VVTNQYSLTEREAAIYARLPKSELRLQALPYLQYKAESPRYYRKKDLDKLVQRNVRGVFNVSGNFNMEGACVT
jgi:hypothetical protein